MLNQFRQRFWLPPRAHGDVIEDRSVSFLELFYDLVYVVVIAQAAHHLSAHLTWRGWLEFAIVFGLVWFAWLNGTMWYELHGREDGRTRTFTLLQMLFLAVLAVFTGEATTETGQEFALVYVGFLGIIFWLYYTVRRQDSDEFQTITALFLKGLVATMVLMGVSAFLPADARLAVWAVFVVSWVIGQYAFALRAESGIQEALVVTESMVERFGLFVIIVLGEVVVGVVNGLSETEHTAISIATGLLGLSVGFAYWWTYFDFVGRRLPQDGGTRHAQWMGTQLPVTFSIAAAGAAMVPLIEHASDPRSPSQTAWVLTGSVAIGLIAMAGTMRSLKDFNRLPSIYQPVTKAMYGAALLVLVIGWLRPAPWLLTLGVVVTLSAVWVFSVTRWLSLPNPALILPNAVEITD